MSKPRQPQALDRRMRRILEIDVVIFPRISGRPRALPWSLGTALPAHARNAKPSCDTRIVRRRLLTLRGILLVNPTSCKRQLSPRCRRPAAFRCSIKRHAKSNFSAKSIPGAIGSWTTTTPSSATPRLIRHYDRASHDGSLESLRFCPRHADGAAERRY
jgi:hypothetical protein